MLNIMRKNKGFTLIEILVVVAIIGVLAAIGLGSFASTQAKARDSKRKSDLSAISRAVEMYYNDFGRYPTSDASGNIVGCGSTGTTACSWGGSFTATTTYMQDMPSDPNGNYFYVAGGGGANYQIYARLENLEDSSVVQSGGVAGKYTNTSCRSGGKTGCNYGIASSNSSVTTATTDN